MVNGTAELSNDAYAAQELGKILTELRSTLQSMAEENKQLIQTVKYYGYEPWKSVTLLDRGAKARRVYERVMGRRFDEQHKG